MKYIKIIVVVFFCSIYHISIQAQTHEHTHLRNEIGFSGGAIYTFEHKTWGVGTHLHYFHTLGEDSRWSIGGGFEQAWADGHHFTIGAGINCQMIDRLNIGVIPGVTFFKHDDADGHDDSGYHARFSIHFELVYDLWHWEKFHLGPTIDFAWSKGDSHGMLGIHVAYCF